MTASWIRTATSSSGLVVNACTLKWRSSFRTSVTVPIWSKDSPAGMSASPSWGAALGAGHGFFGSKTLKLTTNARTTTGIASSRS